MLSSNETKTSLFLSEKLGIPLTTGTEEKQTFGERICGKAISLLS